MEEHIELYKELRPKRWDELIGQEEVADSLQSSILNNKLPSAYIFSGGSGTGKTTTAFILAKAVNCENLDPETANPCNECSTCRAIDDHSQIGVSYLSAAQRSGVDEMRDIIENASMKVPINKQVFIIDEVHNASNKALEAFLIPLEDPKMNSMFLFCTTEIEKVKGTLQSRLPSLKFNNIGAETMEDYLWDVNDKKNLNLTEEVIRNAVKTGRGNVRSALNYLETVRHTEDFEGGTDFGEQLLNAMATKKIENIFTVVNEASESGIFMRDFAEQLYEDLRNLLLFNAGVNPDMLGVIPVDDPEDVVKGLLGRRGMTLILDEVGLAITQMSRGNDARITLEIALVKSLERLRSLYRQLVARKRKLADG